MRRTKYKNLYTKITRLSNKQRASNRQPKRIYNIFCKYFDKSISVGFNNNSKFQATNKRRNRKKVNQNIEIFMMCRLYKAFTYNIYNVKI